MRKKKIGSCNSLVGRRRVYLSKKKKVGRRRVGGEREKRGKEK
jgi:hypothetical protein